MGNINFEYGDYLVIPRGTIYQLHFNDKNNRIFFVESPTPIHPFLVKNIASASHTLTLALIESPIFAEKNNYYACND
jgi:hypothetical protein